MHNTVAATMPAGSLHQGVVLVVMVVVVADMAGAAGVMVGVGVVPDLLVSGVPAPLLLVVVDHPPAGGQHPHHPHQAGGDHHHPG